MSACGVECEPVSEGGGANQKTARARFSADDSSISDRESLSSLAGGGAPRCAWPTPGEHAMGGIQSSPARPIKARRPDAYPVEAENALLHEACGSQPDFCPFTPSTADGVAAVLHTRGVWIAVVIPALLLVMPLLIAYLPRLDGDEALGLTAGINY